MKCVNEINFETSALGFASSEEDCGQILLSVYI